MDGTKHPTLSMPPAAPSSNRGTRPSLTRKTRFVCISDTHNCTVKLPKGDVLIHAGDLTNQGGHSELSKTLQWLEKSDFEAKIVIAGNHDLTLDTDFYTTHGPTVHNQNPQDTSQSHSLITSSPTITYLHHSPATIRLSSPSGPRTTFSIFGSPYSPHNPARGLWAFGYDRAGPEADALWAAVPLDTDVLVTHTPPRGLCDAGQGCEALRTAAGRVRPRLLVCGHVHGARGVERVRWGGDGTKEADGVSRQPGTGAWRDPGTGGRISLVDLTGRRGGVRLDNDGWLGEPGEGYGFEGSKGDAASGSQGKGGRDGFGRESGDELQSLASSSSDEPEPAGEAATPMPSDDPSAAAAVPGMGAGDSEKSPAQNDMAALWGRMGRPETCVVNCAITATSWPHMGGRRFNKPIVVDLDLPVWESEE